MNKKSDADSDFSQNFFIFGNFVHACCFMTHMITHPWRKTRVTASRETRLATLGDVFGRLRIDPFDQAQMPLRASLAPCRKESERIELYL